MGAQVFVHDTSGNELEVSSMDCSKKLTINFGGYTFRKICLGWRSSRVIPEGKLHVKPAAT